MSRKDPMTTQTFVEKSNQKHRNKYDYTQTVYVHYKTPVIIICPLHGPFSQNPMHHLRGNGCPHCMRENNGNKYRKANNQVISDFQSLHGNKYNYSKIQYKNTHTKIEIVCPKHGSFFQKPNDHLHGMGCPQCARSEQTKTLQTFINEAKQIHGDKYDYSKTQYTNNHTKVEIICPEHGSFFVLPTNHIIHNSGCPQCYKSIGVYTEHFFNINPELKNVDALIYFVEFYNDKEKFQKIGITQRTLNKRFSSRKGYKLLSKYEKILPLYQAFQLEQQIIKIWEKNRYQPSVPIGGDSECFHLENQQCLDIIKYIQEQYSKGV